MFEYIAKLGVEFAARLRELPALESVMIICTVSFFAVILTGMKILWAQWRADVKANTTEKRERDKMLHETNEEHFAKLEALVNKFSEAMSATAASNAKIAQAINSIEHHVSQSNELTKAFSQTLTSALINRTL